MVGRMDGKMDGYEGIKYQSLEHNAMQTRNVQENSFNLTRNLPKSYDKELNGCKE